jgi:crotonobetainyl-CoA:carnitine CoA-transferase CaiB-like acyl-CoA transferase
MFAANRLGGDFQNLNRNKRSLSLNIKQPAGLAVLMRLLASADVVVENWRPDVKHRLGLGYATLKTLNPRLIMASISGFGQDGPYASRPGFDQIIQGIGGLMSITGLPGQGPVRAGIAVADSSTGLYAAIGILIALRDRERTGFGQWVEISLLHSQIAMLDFQAARYLNEGEIPVATGNDHPTASPMGLFDALDGALNLGCSGEGTWVRLCQAIGRIDLVGAQAFATERLRVQNREALTTTLNKVFQTKSVSDWVDLLNDAGVPAGPIYTIPQMFEDPQVKHLEVVADATTSDGHVAHLITQPIKLSRTPAKVELAAPGWGEQTDDILRAEGYSVESIAELRQSGAI